MGNINREMETLRKSKEIKGKDKNLKTPNRIMNAFNGLNSRLRKAKEIIGRLEDRAIETSLTEMQRQKRMGVGQGMWVKASKNSGTISKEEIDT